MSNVQFQNIYKSIPLIWLLSILGVSLASALFMPAMFTFSFGFPALILAFIYIKSKSLITFFSLFGGIVFISVITLGILYLLPFFFFIHLFPTYVVILITLFIMRLIPYNLSNISVILIFLLLSTLIGLNIKIVPLLSAMVKPQYTVQEQINEVLQITKDDSLQIIGNAQSFFPDKYLTNDFISFGANEGCGCGYWEYPQISFLPIQAILLEHEITYTQLNNSTKRLKVNYEETNSLYTLLLEVKDANKTLSSLNITDRLPYRSNINRKELDAFEPRLEYLLRHNLWNGLLFYVWDGVHYLYGTKKKNSEVISEFIQKSIYAPNKDKKWSEHIIEVQSRLLYESKLGDCSTSNRDDYKDYPFNQWKNRYADTSVKAVPNSSYLFDFNNTIYSTKERADGKNWWHHHNFAYSTSKHVYTFKTFHDGRNIRIYQFSKTGDFITELHFKLPQEVILKGRQWHPISHVSVTDNKMLFRVYDIYENRNNKNQCKYYQLETNF